METIPWGQQQQRVLGLTTTCFDLSVVETFLPLVLGAQTSVVVVVVGMACGLLFVCIYICVYTSKSLCTSSSPPCNPPPTPQQPLNNNRRPPLPRGHRRATRPVRPHLPDRRTGDHVHAGTFLVCCMCFVCCHANKSMAHSPSPPPSSLTLYTLTHPNPKPKKTKQATPATLELMATALNWQPPSRLTILCGGEAFRPSLLPLARTARAVFNGYGACVCGGERGAARAQDTYMCTHTYTRSLCLSLTLIHMHTRTKNRPHGVDGVGDDVPHPSGAVRLLGAGEGEAKRRGRERRGVHVYVGVYMLRRGMSVCMCV